MPRLLLALLGNCCETFIIGYRSFQIRFHNCIWSNTTQIIGISLATLIFIGLKLIQSSVISLR